MKTYEESEELNGADTEITLGMRSILGIFFGLVLVCGVFFGFGYSLGRGNTSKATASAQVNPYALEATQPSAVKTVVEQSGSSNTNASGNDLNASPTAKPSGAVLPPPPSPAATVAPQTPTAATAVSENPVTPNGAQVTKASYNVPVNAAPASSPIPASGTQGAAIMVQIAAVSRRGDADVLVAALQKLGYSASVRSETTNNLLHVQIGPFATRDQAQMMRTKLLNDGYNAILK
jgi:cell division septation protein DedD